MSRRRSPSKPPAPTSREARSSGGRAGSAGYDFQARVYAYVACHILVGQRLDWLDGIVKDVPIAIEMETGGAGDDLGINLLDSDTVMEVQVKRGLSGKAKVLQALRGFREKLKPGGAIEGVLVVDGYVPSRLRDFREDLRAIRQGRVSSLRAIAAHVLSKLQAEGTAHICRQLTVVKLDLEHRSDSHHKAAVQALHFAFGDEDVAVRAFDLLIRDGHEQMRLKGRRTLQSLKALLESQGFLLRSPQDSRGGSVARWSPLASTPHLGARLAADGSTPDAGSGATATDEVLISINHARALLEAGHVDSALSSLRLLKRSALVDPAAAMREGLPIPSVEADVMRQLHGNMGAALFRLGRFIEARAEFERSLELVPAHAGSLSNLARTEYMLGDFESAERFAWQAVATSRESAATWALLTEILSARGRTLPEVGLQSPPANVRESADFRSGLASAAFGQGDTAAAIAIARSVVEVDRSPERLGFLAQALVAHTRSPFRMLGATSELREAEELATEALAALPDEFSVVTQQLRLLRADVRRQSGELSNALDDARHAFRFHPPSTPGAWRPACVVAAIHLEADRSADALSVLEMVPTDDRPVPYHVLRARALAEADQVDEVARVIDDALSLISEAPAKEELSNIEESIIALAEIALEAGLLHRSESILQECLTDSEKDQWVVRLLNARIAARRSTDGLAMELYRNAATTAPAEAAPRIWFELAVSFGRAGRFAEAVEAYEAGNAWTFDDEVRPGYVAALLESEQYSKADALLRALEGAAPLPHWAVSAAALLAHRRNDVDGVVRYLEQLVSLRPTSVTSKIRLVQAYARLDEGEKAMQLLEQVLDQPNLEVREWAKIAQILLALGEPTRAVGAALNALVLARDTEDEEEIERAFLGIALEAEQQGGMPKPLRVEPGTRVVLARPGSGERRVYDILTLLPERPTSKEIAATSDMASLVLGLKTNDTVKLRGKRGREVTYVVAKVESIAGVACRRAFKSLAENPPEDGSVRAIATGVEGTVGYLMPILSEMHRIERHKEEVFANYDEQLLPIGILAKLSGFTFREAYQYLALRKGRLYVEEGKARHWDASVEAAAAEAPLVLTWSMLCTTELLRHALGIDLLDVLKQSDRTVLVPQSLRDELRREVDALRVASQRGVKRMGPGPAGIQIVDIPAEQIADEYNRWRSILVWVQKHASVHPRSIGSIGSEVRQSREAIGASSFDALDAAATRNAVLYADDLGLLRFARSLKNVGACSTWATLHVLVKRGFITEREHRQAILCLAQANHYFVPLNAPLLSGLLADEHYQFTPRLRPVFDRLGDPAIESSSAITAVAATLKTVALEGLGLGALGAVIAECLPLLTAHRPTFPVLAELERAVADDFVLLPGLQAEVREQIQRFLQAKSAAGAIL
jgi:tetratricopeptide (TPR) repeat protein